MHHGPAVADALDVSTDEKVPGDGGGTVAAAGACTHGIASAPAFGAVYKPAHHGSARPAVLRALSCNAVVVAWLPVLSCCGGLQGCALCAVRCPFDAIRMVRTQPSLKTFSVVLDAIRHF